MPDGFEPSDVLDRAAKAVEGKSRSYVEDALVFAKRLIALEAEHAKLKANHRSALDNLTATQARCTQLLVENRALRGTDG
jgi:hypothetical protein